MHAAELFRTFFFPFYPADAAADLERARRQDANPAKNPALPGELAQAAEVFRVRGPDLLGLDLHLDFSDASVHRLSARLTRERVAGWIAEPPSPDSTLLRIAMHGTAYVGECVVRGHAGVWSVRRPLWESVILLSSRLGDASLQIFQWWLKALAGEGDATLADRYRAYVEVPCTRPEELPLVVASPRSLPRLRSDRYDVFYKYMRAHLPEFRELGEDFPSAERFGGYGFRFLDFLLVGGGRMLALAGLGEGGVSIFWLDGDGFKKSAFFEADSMPEPRVLAEDEKITVTVSRDGKVIRHELPWWGP